MAPSSCARALRSRAFVLRRPVACFAAALLVAPVCLGTVAAWAEPAGAAVDDTDPAVAWVRPVPGAVVVPFDAPEIAWAPGHRGVDFEAPAGMPVVAAGTGTVAFAGEVAGTVHVVVDHGGGLLTGYSFLRDASVRAGDHVERGAVVGHSGGTDGAAHSGDVVHVSLRLGEEYLDPMVLFGRVDLVASIHLVPHVRERAEAVDAHDVLVDLEYELQRSDTLPAWLRNEEWIEEQRRARRGFFEKVRDGAGSAFGWAAHQGRRFLDAYAELERSIVPVSPLGAALEMYDAFDRWRDQGCTTQATAAGPPVSYHHGMFVAGLNSHTDAQGHTADFPLEELYAQENARWYSYPSEGADGYEAADTHGPVIDAARALRDQLVALHDDGAAEVDLLAHSQGGVVVAAFLTYFYDPTDPELPLVTKVVTIASPLEGAPLAGLGQGLAATPVGAVVDAPLGLPLDAPAIRDLAPGSEVMEAIAGFAQRHDIDVLSVSAPGDPLAPVTATDVPGATVVPDFAVGGSPHTAVLTDADAYDTVRTFLADDGALCASLWDHLGGALTGSVTEDLERWPSRPLPGP